MKKRFSRFRVERAAGRGDLTLSQLSENLNFRWFDPVKGESTGQGEITGVEQQFSVEKGIPMVLIIN